MVEDVVYGAGHHYLCARVSSHDQRSDLDRQVAPKSEWAAKTGHRVVRVKAEVGSGMNGSRTQLRRLLADPKVSTVVVERRDRLARMNADLVESALSAHGRRLVVVDTGEVDDDLVRDKTEVLTNFCARLYGRRLVRRASSSREPAPPPRACTTVRGGLARRRAGPYPARGRRH